MHDNGNIKSGDTNQAFLLFVFSFSFLFTAFFSLVSSSFTLTPSSLASAFSNCSRSSAALRFSSGNAASFSFRAASWERACVGFEETLWCFAAFEVFAPPDPESRAENATEVSLDWGPADLGSGTRSWFCVVFFVRYACVGKIEITSPGLTCGYQTWPVHQVTS